MTPDERVSRVLGQLLHGMTKASPQDIAVVTRWIGEVSEEEDELVEEVMNFRALIDVQGPFVVIFRSDEQGRVMVGREGPYYIYCGLRDRCWYTFIIDHPDCLIGPYPFIERLYEYIVPRLGRLN